MANAREQISVPTLAQGRGPKAWVVLVVLAAPLLFVYGRALRAPLIFDDASSLVQNTSLHSLWPLVGTHEHPGPLRPAADLPTAGRPLVNLTFALNYRFGGVDPFGYHVFNLLIHCFSALLLFAIVRRTLLLPRFRGRFESSSGWLALTAALVWSLHPLQTEAVIYITQRTELMFAFFLFATLYCSLRYLQLRPFPWEDLVRRDGSLEPIPKQSRRGGQSQFAPKTPQIWDSPRPFWDRLLHTVYSSSPQSPASNAQSPGLVWLFLATLSSACGMACKEVMVVAPLVVLLFDRAFVSGSFIASLRRSKPLYVALAATWLVLVALNLSTPRSKSAGFHLGLSLPIWWATQCKVVLTYLKLAIWPDPLLLHYELPYLETVSSAWVYVLLVIMLAGVALVLFWRNTATGFALVVAAMVLAPTSIVPIPTEMAAERRMYVPLAALVSLVVVGGYVLIRNCFASQSDVRRSSQGANAGPMLGIACGLLVASVFGIVSAARLQTYNDPLQLWQQVADHQPNNYMALYNLGLLLNHAGREEESFRALQAAVAANPNAANSHSAFGFALLNAGRIPEAIESLKAALALEPNHVGALNNMGRALIMTEQNAEAVAYLKRALELNSGHADAHHNLGKALANTGQLDAAIDELKTAQRLAPDDLDVVNSLATALSFGNRVTEAIEVLQEAVARQPGNGALRNSLGVAFMRAGDTARAADQFQQFLKLNPHDAGAHINLGNVYLEQGNYGQALPHYEAAAKLAPDFPAAHFSLGLALAKLQRLPEAIAEFQAVLRLNPSFLPVFVSLADAQAAAGQSDEAIRTAAQGLERARAAGDDAGAKQLEEWLRKHQQNPPTPTAPADTPPAN